MRVGVVKHLLLVLVLLLLLLRLHERRLLRLLLRG